MTMGHCIQKPTQYCLTRFHPLFLAGAVVWQGLASASLADGISRPPAKRLETLPCTTSSTQDVTVGAHGSDGISHGGKGAATVGGAIAVGGSQRSVGIAFDSSAGLQARSFKGAAGAQVARRGRRHDAINEQSMGDAAGAVAGQAAQNGADHGAIGPDTQAAATAAPQADSARMFTSGYGAGSAGTAGTAASRAKLTTGEVDSSCVRAVAGAGNNSHGAAAVRPAAGGDNSGGAATESAVAGEQTIAQDEDEPGSGNFDEEEVLQEHSEQEDGVRVEDNLACTTRATVSLLVLLCIQGLVLSEWDNALRGQLLQLCHLMSGMWLGASTDNT